MKKCENDEFEHILRSIRTLAKGGQPETDISDILFQHGCLYLLSRIENPHKYRQQMQTKMHLNHMIINQRYDSCSSIFEVLESASIPYAVIKGAVLSEMVYGNPYRRYSGDIDLLVSRRNIDTVKKILLAHGFLQGRVTDHGLQLFTRRELLFQSSMSHQIAPFTKETGNKLCPYVQVDVNMDIMWGESGQTTDMDFVLQHTVKRNICGKEIRKLTPEMEFIALCLHHYKDMNSIYLLAQGKMQLKLLCDVFFYVKNNYKKQQSGDSLQLNKLVALCYRLKVSEYVYYCLYYTDYVFDDPLLKELCSYLCSPESARILNSFGLTEHECRAWDISFSERLFSLDIKEYFQRTLPEEMLEKIRINEAFM